MDALLADGAAELSASLEDGLREWREAAAEQDGRLSEFVAATRCSPPVTETPPHPTPPRH